MSRISRLTTLASTGRRMKMSVNDIAWRPAIASGRSSGRLRGCVLSMRIEAPGLSLSCPVVTTSSPAATPEGNGDAVLAHLAGAARSGARRRGGCSARLARLAAGAASPSLRRRRLHDVDAVAVEAVGDGRARDGDHIGGLARPAR